MNSTLIRRTSRTLEVETVTGDDKKSVTITKRLFLHHEVSELRRMKYIKSGYRKDLGAVECVQSGLLHLHNESLNVWTHLIAFVIFAIITSWTVWFELASVSWTHQVIFLVFLLAATNCFLSSTIYHLFLGHESDEMIEKVTRLDWSGISLLILASFYPPIFYTFYCYPVSQAIYLGSVSILGLCGIVGPHFAFYHRDDFFPYRILLMGGTAASGIIPLIHSRLIEHPVLDPALGIMSHDEIQLRILLMYGFYAMGFIVYITRFPECINPGKFDYLLNSHQLWHILVFFGAYIHYLNCLNIYQRWQAHYPSGECTPL